MEGFAIVNGVPNFSICERCKQAIKHVYVWQGKKYGADCIQVVTGARVEDWYVGPGGVIDEEETARRKAAKEATRQAEIADAARREAEYQARVERYTAENHWLRWELLAVATTGSFAESIALDLTRRPVHDFPDKALAIMAEMYGKRFGRKGSKKYEAAAEEFWVKVGASEEAHAGR